jgi:2-polyprenyl-3-methyl-5-hydroxy-6-metoxy-1,4-benzoquinol methylase
VAHTDLETTAATDALLDGQPETCRPVKRWTEINWQPNSRAVLEFRKRELDAAHRPPCNDRVDYLVELARGKRVLDVGVVDHVVTETKRSDWLHGRIIEAASYVLGVDIMDTGTRLLREQGYNVRRCDITRDDPGEGAFDLVICGELIEHLGNPQALFDAAAKVLVPSGRLVLTTPNPYYLGRTLRHLLGRDRESVDHATLLFPSGIAEMASRAGLKLETYRGSLSRPQGGKQRLLAGSFRLATTVIAREAACGTLIYECVNPGSSR